jgi:hypothetical protein
LANSSPVRGFSKAFKFPSGSVMFIIIDSP